ncbi:MAG TPA: RNase adapter RapZ [Ruminococcaceae bacterium]|nr:RNase adapter RapZ [Oscillospiraceae bacterium]
MELIIVTGLSGSGKSRAVNALEDIGFYCIDNMPPSLIVNFAEICMQSQDKLEKVAIVTDMRGGGMFEGVYDALKNLKKIGANYRILFLESSSEVLIRRYKESRRKHPLYENAQGSIENAVTRERELLKPIRAMANYIIDTSYISPAQLKDRVSKLFLGDSSASMQVHCMSFGFKYGSPTEADLVFDVRCLPNPFYIDDLKDLTGLDEPVKKYVLESEETKGFISRLYDMVDYLMPLYCGEGKSQLIIAIGCTGGKHRSVVLAELLYNHLAGQRYRVSVNHRDIRKKL